MTMAKSFPACDRQRHSLGPPILVVETVAGAEALLEFGRPQVNSSSRRKERMQIATHYSITRQQSVRLLPPPPPHRAAVDFAWLTPKDL